MPKFHKNWKVLSHGPIDDLDDGILTVTGLIPVPLGKFPRRMTVVGLSDDRSAIFSAIALREPDMRRIEDAGKPSFLIVPNGHHRLDAHIWKKRYPELTVLCPPSARKNVAEAVPVDATNDVLGDDSVEFVVVGGTDGGEGAMIVRRANGTTLILNDILANVRHPPGLGAKVVARLAGFGVKGPQVPRVVKQFMVTDKRELAGQFRAWAGEPRLRRIIVSHGDIIQLKPDEVLRSLADELKS